MLIPMGILASSGAAGADFEHISTINADGSASSITFSSIPQTFKHLQIRYSVRSKENSTVPRFIWLAYNGVNYDNKEHILNGNGSTVTSTVDPTGGYGLVSYVPNFTGTSGSYAAGIMDVLDYSNANKKATFRNFSGYTNGASSAGSPAGISNVQLNSAMSLTALNVTSLTFTTYMFNAYEAPSRFSLYGIKG